MDPPPVPEQSNGRDQASFVDGKMKKDFTLVGDPMRKVSSGTLNRLILVAQALESEVDTRRKTEIHGGKIVIAVRTANMVILCLMNFLIFTGLGSYTQRVSNKTTHQNLAMTPDKWVFKSGEVPAAFQNMNLSLQFVAASITVTLLFTTSLVQLLTVCRIGNTKVMSLVLTIACVPCCLFVFGLQMHYSACPWVEEYIRSGPRGNRQAEPPVCGINGWALAGIFTLLSCALFVAEGLVTSFFRQQAQFRTRKHTML